MLAFSMLFGRQKHFFMGKHGEGDVEVKQVTCACVGSSMKQKTFLSTFTHNAFPEEGPVAAFNRFCVKVQFPDRSGQLQHVMLKIYDVLGDDGGKDLREREFGDTKFDVFVVTFSLVNRASLEKVQSIWRTEIDSGAAIVLVGLASDRRDDIMAGRIPAEEGETPVPTASGLGMKDTIGAQEYIECSAKLGQNTNAVLEAAAKIGLRHQARVKAAERARRRRCEVA